MGGDQKTNGKCQEGFSLACRGLKLQSFIPRERNIIYQGPEFKWSFVHMGMMTLSLAVKQRRHFVLVFQLGCINWDVSGCINWDVSGCISNQHVSTGTYQDVSIGTYQDVSTGMYQQSTCINWDVSGCINWDASACINWDVPVAGERNSYGQKGEVDVECETPVSPISKVS